MLEHEPSPTESAPSVVLRDLGFREAGIQSGTLTPKTFFIETLNGKPQAVAVDETGKEWVMKGQEPEETRQLLTKKAFTEMAAPSSEELQAA